MFLYVTIAWALLLTFDLGRRFVMARGAPYSPEEDSIILSTSVTADIQGALHAIGSERSINAIKQRRNELRKTGRLNGSRSRPAGKDTLTALAAADDTAQAHVARLKAELAEAEQRAEKARGALRTRLGEGD